MYWLFYIMLLFKNYINAVFQDVNYLFDDVAEGCLGVAVKSFASSYAHALSVL